MYLILWSAATTETTKLDEAVTLLTSVRTVQDINFCDQNVFPQLLQKTAEILA